MLKPDAEIQKTARFSACLCSVIIPAYNEEAFIAQAIRSVQQHYTPLEIIVVANSCTDNTAAIAKEYGARVIETDTQGISFAKNLGAKEAKGAVYLFMDADCIMQQGFIDAVIHAIMQGYDGGKARLKTYDDPSLKSKALDLIRDILSRLWERVPNLDKSGGGALTYLTQDLFTKIAQCYGEAWNSRQLVMEDIDFHTKIKKQGRYKYLVNPCVLTSARRFIEEGYLCSALEDLLHLLNPKGKTRARWGKK